jgi:hypothetical protein
MKYSQILPLIFILTACAPVQAVAPTVTAVPSVEAATSTTSPTETLTVAPTSTKEPMATDTLEPTAAPTETALPKENFSDLHPSKTIAEALQSKDFVNRNDILSLRLVREVASKAKPFDDSIKPAKVYLDDEGTGAIVIALNPADVLVDPSKSPCVIESTYKYREYGQDMILVIERFKTDAGDRYLQFLFPAKYPVQGLNQLKKQIIVMPYYKMIKMDKLVEDFKKSPDSELTADLRWYKYIEDVQAMMEKWVETGVIPEELSKYPLEPRPTSRYIPQ